MDVYAGSGRGDRVLGGCARSARSNLFLERRAWNARAGFLLERQAQDSTQRIMFSLVGKRNRILWAQA